MAWPFRRRALTASVSVVPHDQSAPLGLRRSKDQLWQEDAYVALHTLGELRFAARYIANALARCRFYVGWRDHIGESVLPITDDSKPEDKKYRDLLNRIRPRIGDFSSLVRVYGVQQFVAGEDYLVAEDGLEGERWEFLSTSELRRVGRQQTTSRGTTVLTDDFTQYTKIQSDGSEVEISANSVVLRMWTRDAQFRGRADSPVRAVLDICDALITAQAMQTAGDKSRLGTAGLLLAPTEADLPKAPNSDSSGGPQQPPRLMLLDELLETMNTAMTDPGSPASLVPIIAEVRGDLIDKFKHLTFNREIDATIVARIDHLIRRLAQGLDIPPEIMLGMGDSSHWSAWSISEDAVGAHVIPMATNLCEDLTVGFLRPTLAAMGVTDLDRYAVGFDSSELVINPNQSDHAVLAYDRDIMGGDHMLRIMGFDPSMKPDMAEIIQNILITRAKNPRNPDPGADIAALLGKIPPPIASEKPVPSLPPEEQPAQNPQVPEQSGKEQPKAGTQEAKDAQQKGPPPNRPAPTPDVSTREGRGAGKKGGRGIKKVSVDEAWLEVFDEDDDDDDDDDT